MANGVFCQFGDAVQIELAHDVATMNLDRAGGDMQLGGDLRRGIPLSQKGQYFAFAAAQLPAHWFSGRLSRLHGLDDDCGNLRAEIRATQGRFANASQQIVAACGLDDIAA